jgi:uncharacterized protein involved in exopolysaccharide biosynthesis
MTLRDVLGAIVRWWWLILALSMSVTAVLTLRMVPAYTSSVTFQITQPPSEQVLMFDQAPPYSNLRDELTIARNDFMEAARSPIVREQTIAALKLTGASANYALGVADRRDSDLVTLTVDAPVAASAQTIAQTHASFAINEAARLRALPAVMVKQVLTQQLTAAAATLDQAERGAQADPASVSAQAKLTQAQTDYRFWQKKLTEAEIKADSTYASSFIQITSPANLPSQPSVQKIRMQQVMGAVGSLVVGIVLALALNSMTRRGSELARQPGSSVLAPR